MSDLLTDEQLYELGRIKIGLVKIQEAIQRVNRLSKETGLEIREVPLFPLGMTGNDIAVLVRAHEIAENAIKARAQAALEKAAA